MTVIHTVEWHKNSVYLAKHISKWPLCDEQCDISMQNVFAMDVIPSDIYSPTAIKIAKKHQQNTFVK